VSLKNPSTLRGETPKTEVTRNSSVVSLSSVPPTPPVEALRVDQLSYNQRVRRPDASR
jgi:hypothetical protein